jgi:predicted dehydrogenase
MSAPTRIGVIGCGFFSGNHLNSWRDLRQTGAELAAICDMDGAKAKAAAERFGIGDVRRRDARSCRHRYPGALA